MERKSFGAKYRWLLFLGLFLWIGGDACYLLFNRMPSNDILFSQLSVRGITFALLATLILDSAFEELIFRGWSAIQEKKYWLSLALQTLFCLLTSNLIIGISVGAISGCIVFALRNSSRKTELMAIASSLFFGLAHTGRLYTIEWISLAFIIGTIGFGMILTFVAVNFKLRYAIILHISFNLIITILVAYGQFLYDRHSTITYRDNLFTFEAKQGYQPKSFHYSFSDTLIQYHATIGGMVEHMMTEYHKSLGLNPDDMHVIYQYDSNPQHSNLYETTFRSVSTPLSQKDYRKIIKKLEDTGLYKLDTTYQNIWVLTISNPATAGGHPNNSYRLSYLITDLRFKFNLPVFADIGTNKEYPLTNSLSQKIHNTNNIQECISLLKDYGIELYEDSLSKAQVIRIID